MQDHRASLTREHERSRRGRPRDAAVDAAILAAAVELLATVGYTRLTMDQVAAHAGVGKASVYLRWPNKVALVAEAIERQAAVVPEVPDTGNLRTDMLTFLRALLQRKSAAQRAVAAVSGELASNSELRQAWRRGVSGTLSECMRVIVERAIKRGELPPNSDVELLSMLPLTLLQNWRLEHEQGPNESVVARIVTQFYSPS
jgi:AcrR family transcriptional regulator